MGAFKGVSARAVAGFACQQGFLYGLFYLGSNRAVDIGGIPFERIDLLLTFVFMACAFAAVRLASARARDALLAPTLVGWYAVLLVVGSLLVTLPLDAGVAEVAAEGALVGLPSGLLLCAWGRAMLAGTRQGGAREVLFGTAVGAAVSLAVAAVPFPGAADILKLLPIGSAWALRSLAEEGRPAKEGPSEGASNASSRSGQLGVVGSASEGDLDGTVPAANASVGAVSGGEGSPLSLASLVATPEERAAALRLSGKVIAGTALFGLAGGFMEVFSSDPGMTSAPAFPATLLILVLFCIGAAQFLVARSNRAPETDPAAGEGKLAGAYRLAILLSLAGYLFVPVLGDFGITGQAIVLAGYLGLTCVLMTLFLAIARAGGQDAASAFARGLLALFAGEAVGIALGNLIELVQPDMAQPYAVAACAGLATLFAFLFLFTERDYVELSSIVGGIDAFDEACARIVSDFGLSKREAEVLPLALRGRTSERIASELFIAKSTVDTHLRRIYGKAGVHGRQELIDLGERVQQQIAQGR